VPTGPRLISSGNAVGLIQYDAVFFADPVSIHRPCAPPRSSGAVKRKNDDGYRPGLKLGVSLKWHHRKPATRSDARRFQIIANYSMSSPLRPFD